MNKSVCLTAALIICVLLLCACGAKVTDKDEKPGADITPQPHSVSESDSAVTSETSYSGEPSVEVTASVAYIFDALEGNELYAACEYKNNSNCPCIVTSVKYTVDISGSEVEVLAEQPAAKYCVLLPNETFYNAVWNEYEPKTGDTVSIKSVDITCEKCTDMQYTRLEVNDMFLVQNYPGFASVSGNVKSTGRSVSLNEIYTAFYDEGGRFLGVWYFTDASEISNESKHFTTHLRSLPIEGLSEKTAEIKAVGFGFNEKDN